MRYSVEPRVRRYVKGHGFLSLAKNTGENVSNKYGLKLVDSAKKSATDALKIADKRTIQKRAEATGDLVGNTIANKITSISTGFHSKTHASEPHSFQKKDIYLHKKDKKLLMN